MPAIDLQELTVGKMLKALRSDGDDNFLPDFDKDFERVSKIIDKISNNLYDNYNDIRVVDLDFSEDDINNK